MEIKDLIFFSLPCLSIHLYLVYFALVYPEQSYITCAVLFYYVLVYPAQSYITCIDSVILSFLVSKTYLEFFLTLFFVLHT